MRLTLAISLLAGCGFDIDGSAPGDAVIVDAPPDGMMSDAIDAPSDVMIGPGFCTTPKVWEADFSTDPRALDGNGDGVLDWAIRNAAPSDPLPGTLAGGVWTEPAPPIRSLDTQPKQNFATRTRVTLRMRHVDQSVSNDQYGAVFWINVGFGDALFAPLWVSLTRVNNKQDVFLYTKTAAQLPITLASRNNLDTGMADIVLLVDPILHTVTLTADGQTTTSPFMEIPVAGNDDRWASLNAWSSACEFDSIRVEVCP